MKNDRAKELSGTARFFARFFAVSPSSGLIVISSNGLSSLLSYGQKSPDYFQVTIKQVCIEPNPDHSNRILAAEYQPLSCPS